MFLKGPPLVAMALIFLANHYLPPTEVNNEECFDVYEVCEYKNGISTELENEIFGKGVSILLNDNTFTTYSKSILYKSKIGLFPFETIEIDGLILPKNTTISFDKPFYLNKKKMFDYFEIDIEREGILISEEEDIIIPDGVSFSSLKTNISTLGFTHIAEDIYEYYKEDGTLIAIATINDEECHIQWFYEHGLQTPINQIIQVLFPTSYPYICSNMMSLNSNIYDNRFIQIYLTEQGYIQLDIKNNISFMRCYFFINKSFNSFSKSSLLSIVISISSLYLIQAVNNLIKFLQEIFFSTLFTFVIKILVLYFLHNSTNFIAILECNPSSNCME